ncbi:MAG: hypothetical protein B7X95_05750 [Methylophilaceae bacterium 17-44-8]|nr:MAG: hypothetical protein B7X95_05750 [Methylophilaceae bacterium 17-44-8]
MALKRNFSVGLFGSIWSALLGLAVVPLYIKYLGTEAYGLIGFFATTQALLQLLDLVLSPTINREVARCSATNIMQEARSLLHTLSVVYWCMALVIGLVILILAPLIANHWLQARALPIVTITQALMLMGLVVACRWPVGLYMGALMGMQRVALSSMINAAFGTLSSLGTVAVLILVSPTIKAFFIWQACVGVCYALIMHFVAWRVVKGKHEKRHFSLDDLKRIWKFTAGMSFLAITGVLLVQIDKVILSKLLSLESFGHYVLAGVVANSLYILLTPLFNAIYPRMTALVASGDIDKLKSLYKAGTRLFLSVFFPLVLTGAFYSKDLLYIWTRDVNLAENTALVCSLLLLGTGLNGAMHFPFALQLAYGNTKIPLTVTSVLILTLVPLTFVLTINYGARGGALAWLILNICYLLFGTWLTHKKLLIGQGWNWLMNCVGLQLLTSLVMITIGWYLTYEATSYFYNFMWGGCFMLSSIIINYILMPSEIKSKFELWYKYKTITPS